MAELLARRDRGPAGGHGQHDPETDGDHRSDGNPDARDFIEDTRLPERPRRAEEKDEIAGKVELQESHIPLKAERVPDGVRHQVRGWNAQRIFRL